MAPPVYSKQFGYARYGPGGGVTDIELPDTATYVLRDISGFVGAELGGPADFSLIYLGAVFFYRACGQGAILPFHQECRVVIPGPGLIQAVCGGGAGYGAVVLSGYELAP